MKCSKLWHLVALFALAMLPLAGCSGGNGGPGQDSNGYKFVASGVFDGGSDKAVASEPNSTPDVNEVVVIDAQDGKILGSAPIANGKYENLTFSYPADKGIFVFKATVNGKTLRSVVPIDLSNPPKGLVNSKPIEVNINSSTEAIAKIVSQALGLTGTLGDGGQTLDSVKKTYADALTLVKDNGGQVLSYSGTGALEFAVNAGDSSLLPAKAYSDFTSDDVMNIKLGGSITSAFIPTSNPVVNVTVTNAATGKGISGLPASKFTVHVAQLRADGATWLNYKLNAEGVKQGTSDRSFLPTNITGSTVIDKGDGSYTIYVNLDVNNSDALVLSKLDDATKNSAKLTYDPKLIHRIAIGVNATGAINPATNAAVASNPNNVAGLVYDFIPAEGKQYVNPNGGNFARDLVTMAACDSCHGPLVNHGHHFGSRPDTKICVVCHTVQNKKTGKPSAEFTNLIHILHMGKDRTVKVTDIAGIDASEIGYPQDPRNCAKCHTGKDSIKQVGMKPTQFACVSCHEGKTHIVTDKACSECHAAGSFGTAHTRTGSSLTFEITDATIVSGKAVVKFKMNLDGITALKAFTTQTKTAAVGYNGAATTAYGIGTLVDGYGPETRTNSRGAATYPTIRVDYAKAQDGITNPDDFNANVSATLDALWDGSKGTLTYDSASGVYTATIAAAPTLPATGTLMATAKIVGYGTFTKSGATTGGIQFQNVSKAVTGTGFTARRTIVSNDKCNACHEKLGNKPNFHSGMRNDAPTCSGCHTPNLTNSGWSVNASTFVHAIHGRDKRTDHYKWEDIDWTELTYPGVLRNCEQCHVAGSYDFSGAANRAAAGNSRLLFSTAVSGIILDTNINKSPYITVGQDYGDAGTGTNLVNSPISAACFSCHDTEAAKSHMVSNGGAIYEARATAIQKKESCLVCHGPRGADTTLPVTGAVPTIKTVHRWW